MKILAIIPARMGSSRFPGKPMEKINGKPMIGHVFEEVSRSEILEKVAVATCDKIIYDYIISIGGNAVMTGNHHERASDRCAEALLKLEDEYDLKYDIVVMVQGDEPMTHPNMITEAVQPLIEDNNVKISNLIAKIDTVEEFEDRNCIKVVCDLDLNAIYFSREPIPTRSKEGSVSMNKQVCVIPFQRDFLIEYTEMEPTPLEISKSVDMIRVLEHGMKVKMVLTKYNTKAVDTKEDLQHVERLMAKK